MVHAHLDLAATSQAFVWTSITSGSLSGSNLTITSGLGTAFDQYLFILKDISVTGDANIRAEFSDDGGSSYAVGAEGQRWSDPVVVNFLTQPVRLNANAIIVASSSANLLLYIKSNLLPDYKTMEWNLSGGTRPIQIGADNGVGNANLLTNNDIDAVRISLSAETFDAGTFTVYGR